MSDLQLVTHSIEVPKNTGVEGFLLTVREILKLSRVQSVSIDGKGKVTYKRYAEEVERQPIGIDYEGIEPWSIARNAPDGIEELTLSSTNAGVVLTAILDRASMEGLYPTAFISGPNTILWKWYQYTTNFSLGSNKRLCGLPLLLDRHVPDTALILCAAYTREGAIIDTQKAYKIEMHYVVAPTTDVEVIR